jgi:cubilin
LWRESFWFDGKFLFYFLLSACGGDLQLSTGTFTSPNYPNPNPHGWFCEWRITVPEGKKIILTFNDLRLEAHPFCDNEHVIVSVPFSQGYHVLLWREFTDL